MSSTPRHQDLTTRARIRDAAMARFPQDGFGATTIRAVAADAGVSPALVVHHFGSKEGLREACDRHVVEVFRETKRAAMEEGNLTNPAFAAAAIQIAAPIMRYLGWAMARGHEAADALFDELVREGVAVTRLGVEQGLVKGSADLDSRVVAQMAMQMGMLVLHRHVERNLGIDLLSPQGVAAITPILLEILGGLFNPEILEQIKETYTSVPV